MNLGEMAPDIKLFKTDGSEISLSDNWREQHLMLSFFPMVFDDSSREFLIAIRDNMKFYHSQNVSVNAVSVESPRALKAFKNANNFSFELLSDFNRQAVKAYRSECNNWDGLTGLSRYALFLIKKGGELAAADCPESCGEKPNLKTFQKSLMSVL